MAILTAFGLSSTDPSASQAESVPYMDGLRQSRLVAIQECLFAEDFVVADSIAFRMRRDHPDDPAGVFGKAAVLLSRMIDREEELAPPSLPALLDTVRLRAAAVLDTCPPATAAWMELFLGHSHSHQAVYESRFGSWLSALRHGLRAAEHYDQGLVYDSTCYDLYFGRGMFHYWKSVKAGLLSSIGVIADESDLGYDELRLAADSALISQEAARNGLVWVWIDRHQYDSAIAVCENLARRYPRSKVFLWPLGKARYERGDLSAAMGVYERLRGILASDPGNFYNLIECDYFLALCADDMDDRRRLCTIARRAREYFGEIPSKVRRRQRDKISYLKRAARM